MAFYLLNKSRGITSNKALKEFKHKHNIKKAGFSGVLDPFATGLLIVATDGDTKFLDLFLKSNKTYEGTIYFGKTTDTLDIDGEVTDVCEPYKIEIEIIKSLISKEFMGEIEQIPPIFSNIKVDGQKSHKLARAGKAIELKAVLRKIFLFEMTSHTSDSIDFNIEVSSGTYIRSIARDVGLALGVPSMLTRLVRTKIGNIKVPDTVLDIERKEIIEFKFIKLNDELIRDILNGKSIILEETDDNLVVEGTMGVIWIKKNGSVYKIHKRIE